jgi:hypothetical protein
LQGLLHPDIDAHDDDHTKYGQRFHDYDPVGFGVYCP